MRCLTQAAKLHAQAGRLLFFPPGTSKCKAGAACKYLRMFLGGLAQIKGSRRGVRRSSGTTQSYRPGFCLFSTEFS